jgi:methionyl-tRNA synthetase
VEAALATTLTEKVRSYTSLMHGKEFRKATAELRSIWSAGNAYWEQSEPWKVVKADRDAAAPIMRTAANLVRLFAVLGAPIIPESAERILQSVAPGEKAQWPSDDVAAELTRLAPGAAFTVPPVVFRKIEDSDVTAWEERFGATGA